MNLIQRLLHKDETRIDKNARSIREIPARFISAEDRAQLLARALAGQDVYAYPSADEATIWNLWDGRRIELVAQ